MMKPGDAVRLTGEFLRNTGQAARGEEGRKRWTVVACNCGLCKLGGFVAVDETSFTGGRRHVSMSNLEVV